SMPEYRGSIKIGDASIGGKKVSKKYRGNNLYYSAYVPAGTSLYNFNGYATILTNNWSHVGSIDSPIPSDKVQVLKSNSLQLAYPAQEIQHGIQLNFDPKAWGFDPAHTYLESMYAISNINNVSIKENVPIKVTLDQLKSGFIYAGLKGSAGYPDASLKVSLSGNNLVFSSKAPDSSGHFALQSIGMACFFNDFGDVISLALDSITAY
ncbi:hypothetical protein, partial [Lactobacillus acetotolerans]|uniref:hypothetical protein n=1 Tax=Lactobacillus acetotolerans TaxID=1600 RepID=UPI002FDA3286